ncbi:Crp/Fnr family transcriptional regulator [uncultured Slackia sp.]|uniref:Crp/Fnr family transcriptional regulator n=1 Tax=uncultured Slackia sp. TaxID=665903 RepID=UPI0025DC8174|nr:Crp/Fnr family transcriptional regulator [uncultured Slackia sp.]
MEAINLFVAIHPQLKTVVERMIAENLVRYEVLELEAGEYLFREGDGIRSTFYVQRGLVKLSSNSADGYAKTIFLHKAGTLLGFQEFQEEGPKSSILNARTSMRSTVVVIDAQDFSRYLQANGDACYAMAQYLFSMLALETREAVNSSIYSVLQRFAALLLNLAHEFGANHEPALLPFSNAELAEMLGVHVNSIANAITSLRRSGCIDKQRSYLAIIDFEKLRSVAENLVASE